jgi:hypothetical protein
VRDKPTPQRPGRRSGEMPSATDGDLDPMFGSPRGSRGVKAILLAVLIALSAVTWLVWRSVQYHLGATSALEAGGARIEWDLNAQNWTTGGVTRVSRKKDLNFLRSKGRTAISATGEFLGSDLAELAHLYRPVELELPGIPITDAGLAHLEGLEWLEILDIRGGSLVSISNPQVTNAALVHLRGLRRLQELSLAQRPVNDDGLANLAGLTGLKILDLTGSHVSDAGMRHLLGLVRLEQLYLNGTALSDQGLLQLAALPRLKALSVQETGVTAVGISKLLRLRPELDVYHDFNADDIDKAYR